MSVRALRNAKLNIADDKVRNVKTVVKSKPYCKVTCHSQIKLTSDAMMVGHKWFLNSNYLFDIICAVYLIYISTRREC